MADKRYDDDNNGIYYETTMQGPLVNGWVLNKPLPIVYRIPYDDPDDVDCVMDPYCGNFALTSGLENGKKSLGELIVHLVEKWQKEKDNGKLDEPDNKALVHYLDFMVKA
jgi:hypothetical protein